MGVRATFRSLPGLFRWFVGRLWMAATALIVVAVLDVLAHSYLHVCPLRAARVNRHAIVPVVYGRPLGGEAFAKAARAEIILGGCVVGQVAGVCPYCRWPAVFTLRTPEAVTLDDRTLAELSQAERQAALAFVETIAQQARGDDWLTAVSVTPDDVWIGTVNSGLHRLDRKTGATASFRDREIGDEIHGIRRDGDRVVVEHGGTPVDRFSREAFSTDRGRTWHAL